MLEWIKTTNRSGGERWWATWNSLDCLVHQHADYATWSINTDSNTLAKGKTGTAELARVTVERRLWLLTHGEDV